MVLSDEDRRLFYKLFWGLLAHTNSQLHVLPNEIAPGDLARFTPAQVNELRNALYDHLDLLDRYVSENPERLSAQELAILSSWRYRVAGDFYIMRFLKKYAVFLRATEPAHLYGVLGITDSIEEVIGGYPLPILVKAVLLPFQGRIIYDSLLSTYSIFFGPGVRSDLKETYNRLKDREGIIEQLTSAEGEPQVQASGGRTSRKLAPDWRPMVDDIVAQTEKMRQADTPLQSAALNLLRATAGLVQATLQRPKDEDEVLRRLRQVRTAMTRLEKSRYDS